MRYHRREFLRTAAVAVGALALRSVILGEQKNARPANIIFILADDLGYADVSCYGQTKFRTPNIDALAAEGVRFTQCYAGSTVCAPSRSVLMTGLHTGHTTVRGNTCSVGGTQGQGKRRMSLTDSDRTVAHVLREAGYRTCLVGKWHLGAYDPKAGPLERGFDEFYGWLTREPGFDYFPQKRWHNRELRDVPRNAGGKREYYEPDMCTDEAVRFIQASKDRPFFLYLAHAAPHNPFVVQNLGDFAGESWPQDCKTYAAMIAHLDRSVGRVLQALKDSGIDRQTAVFFCSDNGPRSDYGRRENDVAQFFDSNGPLSGYKRDMTDGGLRVPGIVRWPGSVQAGRTSDAVWYFADFLPTAAEIAGARAPDGIDGISIAPTLLGKPQDTGDRLLYWEFFERGFQQAVRWRNWKAIRTGLHGRLRLYDLAKDEGETRDVAAENPKVIARIEEYLKTARTESPNWPVR